MTYSYTLALRTLRARQQVTLPPSCVGERWDAGIARHALSLARADLANTWRNRHVPMPAGMDRNYAFWRRIGLERVLRCRAAVRVTEDRVAAVVDRDVPLRFAAE